VAGDSHRRRPNSGDDPENLIDPAGETIPAAQMFDRKVIMINGAIVVSK
jgi:hypothetical protein